MVKLGSGWVPPEDYFHGEEGTYPVTLTRIGVEDRDGEFDENATRTFSSQFGEKTVQDWRFYLEDNQYIDAAVAVPFVNKQTGEEQVGKRSTYYAYSCALAGKSLEDVEWTRKHLIGRMALATIEYDDKGIARITNLGAMPKSMVKDKASEKVAVATGAPLREQVAPTAQADDLPF